MKMESISTTCLLGNVFELTKNDSSIASRIIADTVEVGLIKPVDPETKSKKFYDLFTILCIEIFIAMKI